MPQTVQSLTDVVNIALGLLGAPAIQSIDDPGTTLAKFLKPVVLSAVRKVQASYPWPELLVPMDLTPLPTQSLDGMYQFPIPTNFLAFDDSNPQPAVRRGRYLLTDSETLQAMYVSYSEDPGNWGEFLTEAIYYEIAASLALPVTQDAKKAGLMISMAGDMLNRNISLSDAKSSTPMTKPKDFDYTTIRDGGYSTGNRYDYRR